MFNAFNAWMINELWYRLVIGLSATKCWGLRSPCTVVGFLISDNHYYLAQIIILALNVGRLWASEDWSDSWLHASYSCELSLWCSSSELEWGISCSGTYCQCLHGRPQSQLLGGSWKIRLCNRGNSIIVDGCTNEFASIAKLFASKYRSLYNSVSFDKGEMQHILNELDDKMCNYQAVLF